MLKINCIRYTENCKDFFLFLSIGHTRLRFSVDESINTFYILFMYSLTLTPHSFFQKPRIYAAFHKKKSVYSKVLTNHQHFTINTNYKHKIRSNDRIFSFLLGFMVRFSRRCTVSLSLKEYLKDHLCSVFSRFFVIFPPIIRIINKRPSDRIRHLVQCVPMRPFGRIFLCHFVFVYTLTKIASLFLYFRFSDCMPLFPHLNRLNGFYGLLLGRSGAFDALKC
jgi:hypothetical protein